MEDDDNLLPLSGLEHLLYCERQCALIHIEQVWAENRFTEEGKLLHERADSEGHEARPGIEIVRGLRLVSKRLGLSGMADVVELRRGDAGVPMPFPVEYKRGPRRRHAHNEVQLCAQALCLEEMMGVPVPAGALFYGKSKRRLDVEFNAALRHLTEDTAARYHDLVARRVTPPPAQRDARCTHCSLESICMPDVANGHSASSFLDGLLRS